LAKQNSKIFWGKFGDFFQKKGHIVKRIFIYLFIIFFLIFLPFGETLHPK